MTAPPRSHFFAFTHIPKCGGTSVDKAMAKLLGGPPLHHREGARRPAASLDAAQRSQVLFLSGHLLADDPRIALFPQKPVFVSTVRDPVSRIVSYYSYQRQKSDQRPDNERLQSFKQISLDDFALGSMKKFATTGSLCHFFQPGGGFEEAADAIRRRYTLVASLRSLDRFIGLLARYVSGHDAPVAAPVARSSGSSAYTLDKNVAEQLRGAMAEDIKLVKWIEAEEDSMFRRARETLDPIADGLMAQRERALLSPVA